MIKPTVGRVVWFWSNGYKGVYSDDDTQPMAATIAYVHNDHCVNLSIVDHIGKQISLSNITLLQGDEGYKPFAPYAEWTPYQLSLIHI